MIRADQRQQLQDSNDRLNNAVDVVRFGVSFLMVIQVALTLSYRMELVWSCVLPCIGACFLADRLFTHRIKKNKQKIENIDVAMKTIPEDRQDFFALGAQESQEEVEWKKN